MFWPTLVPHAFAPHAFTAVLGLLLPVMLALAIAAGALVVGSTVLRIGVFAASAFAIWAFPGPAMAQAILTAAPAPSLVGYAAEFAAALFFGLASLAVHAVSRHFGVQVGAKRMADAREVIQAGLEHAVQFGIAATQKDGKTPHDPANWDDVARHGAAYAAAQFPGALKTVGLEPDRLADMVLARVKTAVF